MHKSYDMPANQGSCLTHGESNTCANDGDTRLSVIYIDYFIDYRPLLLVLINVEMHVCI